MVEWEVSSQVIKDQIVTKTITLPRKFYYRAGAFRDVKVILNSVYLKKYEH